MPSRWRCAWWVLAALTSVRPVAAQVADAEGRFVPPDKVPSVCLGGERTVRLWLPPSYDRAPTRRYPVLYLHDGQNVFSAAGPHVAFGWGNWEVDKTVARLVREGRMREVILVAVDNSPARYLEYRGPAATYTEAELSQQSRRPPAPNDNRRFEQYCRFLIEELKPRIDRQYRTLPGPADTGLLGSSLGGLVSLALAWDHPEVFGAAACLSGAFQVEKEQFLNQTLRTHAGPPKPVRIYLDSGVTDFTGGDDGRRQTAAVAAELRRLGWTAGKDLEYYLDAEPLSADALARAGLNEGKQQEARTSQHNEFYWRLRVWRPLVFLFPPPASS